ncbi:MAG: hypothetical protein LIO91_00995 [Bacteroidales bacterium]|nr:hypothetical protein [Bacteroidales bacterium]
MKKSLVLAAGLIFLASCSNDDFDGMVNGGDTTVTISASLPSDISSRSYSDGLTATHMDYAVYESGTDTPIIEGTGTFVDRQTTLTLQLVKGKSYEVIFWAQKEGAPYTWDSSTKTVTVDYTNAALNDENRDAFFSVESFTVSGSTTITSTLKRPFAQINVGTNDIDQAGLANKYISATMSVTDVYSAFNLSTGAVDTSTKQNVEFTETPRPNQGKTTTSGDYEKFPVGNKGDYEYLAMAYVLVGKDKQTTDVELGFYDSGDLFNELSVPGAPIQRNYRTNIFGALLTSTIDFTIKIDPIYESDDQYNLNIVWDGKSTSKPAQDANNDWLITTPAELAYVAEQVNSGATTYADETLLLANDLDLGNQPWTPIGGHEKYFKGVFNGQDHTISNLYIKKNDGTDAALFGHVDYAHYNVTSDNITTIKNLKVDNVYIDARVSAWSSDNLNNFATGAGAAAAIVAKGSEYTFVENCHVTNAIIYANHYAGAIGGHIKSGLKNCSANNITVTVVPGLDRDGVQDFGDKAGALVGQLAGTAYYAEVTGNTASNFTITGFRDLGGAFGYAHKSFHESTSSQYHGKITGNSVSNGSVNQSYEGYYSGSTISTVEAFCGRHDSFTLDASNTATDVEVNLVASTSDNLALAIANAPVGSTIKLAAGTYSLPVSGWPTGTLTIDGQGVAKIDDVLNGYVSATKNGSLAWTDTEIHFVNLEMDWASRNYRSTTNAGMYIDNCKIAGTVYCNGPKTVITNCSFDSATPLTTTNVYSLYTWNCADVTVEDCTFNTAWAKSILGYYTSAIDIDLKVKNCNFTSTSSLSWEKAHAAIELHTEKGLTGSLTIDNCKAYGDYKSLWYEVYNADDEPATDYFKVVVDGVTVQEGK